MKGNVGNAGDGVEDINGKATRKWDENVIMLREYLDQAFQMFGPFREHKHLFFRIFLVVLLQ